MRTKDGLIRSVRNIEYDEIDAGHKVLDICEFDKPIYYDYGEGYYYLYDEEEFEELILKHSPNIIDLIEVGDYVNGHKVIMNKKDSKEFYKSKDDFVTCVNYTFEEDEIKTIATKEQMQNIEYRVE